MSLSRQLRAATAVAFLLSAAATLAACSFSPVYGDASLSQSTLQLAFAKPSTRLEQILYQELSLRFGVSRSATAPLLEATVTAADRDVALSDTDDPNEATEATVTATVTITPRAGSDEEPMVFTRQASATYTTNSQVLASRAAADEAAERAAKAVAESLRLAILAALTR